MHRDRWFWLKWILANCLGWGLSLFFCWLMAYWFFSSGSLLTALIIGGIAGILQGSIQWFVLTIHMYHGAAKWILASVAGWALVILAWFIGIEFIEEPAIYLYFGTVPGITTMMAMLLPMAIGQWMVLKKESRRAIWWVPANSIGTTLAIWVWVFNFTSSAWELGWLVFCLPGVIAGIVYGLSTGWVLQKILRSGEKRREAIRNQEPAC